MSVCLILLKGLRFAILEEDYAATDLVDYGSE